MALTAFQKFKFAFEYVLSNESEVYIENADLGGSAKFGLNDAKFTTLKNTVALKSLNRSDAEDIYQRLIWNRVNLGDVENIIVSAKILDAIVDLGFEKATDIIRRVLQSFNYRTGTKKIIQPTDIKSINLIEMNGQSNLFIEELINQLKNFYDVESQVNTDKIVRSEKLPTV